VISETTHANEFRERKWVCFRVSHPAAVVYLCGLGLSELGRNANVQPVTSEDCGSQRKQSADLAIRDHRSAWRWVCISLLLCCSTALATEPAQLDKLLKEGRAFHDRRDYAHAIPILQRAVEVSPRNYLANMLLGVDLLRSGKAADAIVHLQIAVSTDPGDQGAAEALAKAATEVGNFSMAEEVLQTSVKRSNGKAEPVQALAGFSLERFRVLGDMLRSTKRGEGVELRFEAASHAEGSSVRASLLQEAAKANPDQRGIWGELGVAQLELRNRVGVEASLREANQREPDGAETLQLEALLAAVEGRWPDAEMLLRTLGGRSQAALKRVLRKWVPSLVPGNGVQGAVWDCLRNPESQCPLTSELPRSGEGLDAESLYAQGRWEQLVALPQSGKAGQSDWLWRGVASAETWEGRSSRTSSSSSAITSGNAGAPRLSTSSRTSRPRLC
jgi:Flp pilus assembly protein TadD